MIIYDDLWLMTDADADAAPIYRVNAKKIWPNGVSPKRESKIQLRDAIQRSLGHSNQKLWPKVDFGEFHHVYPLEHFRWVATRYLWVYKFEKIHEA